jgi:N-acylglucosamine-6-phosphate 2-epimerase
MPSFNLTQPRGLIVSCQAPVGSPMHEPSVIAALAEAAVNQGAIAVRIESPAHVAAVRQRVTVPIIGLWKQQIPGSEVYITPQFHHAQTIALAGADVIAIDATTRPRPGGETLETLIARIHTELGKPVMADVDTVESAIAAAQAGANVVGTTLYGYTEATRDRRPPGFDLLADLVQRLKVPVICEGGIASAQAARQAIDLGAAAVVVGTAITGVDLQVQAYHAALQAETKGRTLATQDDRHFTLLETANPYYAQFLDARLTEIGLSHPEAAPFFMPPGDAEVPLLILLRDNQQAILGGLMGLTRWNWLFVRKLWVDESLRNQGYGKRLLDLAEQEALQRGCIGSRLNTLSFQAKGFYEKMGYEGVGHIEDYPPGQTYYQFCKRLS